MRNGCCCLLLFFFNDTATTEIYTLSLHDALPISLEGKCCFAFCTLLRLYFSGGERSEEHTSELQSQSNLVCRLLLEKKIRHRRRDERAVVCGGFGRSRVRSGSL